MSTVATAGAVPKLSLTPAARRARADRWFFSATAFLQVVLIVWGFAPSYFLRSVSDLPPLAPLLQLHGALFTAWLLILLVQVWLVAARRTPVHRRLGILGGALALVMLIVGWIAAVDAAGRGSTLPGFTPQAFLIIPILGIVGFAALVAAALFWRLRPDYHKRLMMLATAGGLTGAGIARIPALAPLGPLAFLGIPDLFAVALIVYDRRMLGRVHPATIFGTAFILVLESLQLTAANSAAWLAFAGWMMGSGA